MRSRRGFLVLALFATNVPLVRAQADLDPPAPTDPAASPAPIDDPSLDPTSPVDAPPADARTDPALPDPTIPQPADGVSYESFRSAVPFSLPPVLPFTDPRMDARAARLLERGPELEALARRREARAGSTAVLVAGALGVAVGALLVGLSYVDIDPSTGSPLQELLITGSVVFSAGTLLLLGGLYWFLSSRSEAERAAALQEPGVFRF